MVEVTVAPRGPYSLALTARSATDATRVFRDGMLLAVVPGHGAPEQALAAQHPDGRLLLRADSDESLERLRFCLAVEDDHSEFLRRYERDSLIGVAVLRLQGLRQIRLATVAQSLLRAFCGQLIESSCARAMEKSIVRAATPSVGRLHAPPTADVLGAFAPAELRRLGLHARRGAALTRICRSLDLERLRELPTAAVAERLGRERGFGPWSVGVVALEGLGRHERGLVGDLGLIKLLSALRGRRVEAWETEELLAPYGEWAGLASVYLLKGWAHGLLPVPRIERRAA